MLNPYDALQGPCWPFGEMPRTRAYNAYGFPVIQGREIGIVAAGLFSVTLEFVLDQTMALSEKFSLV
ncbi:MAG TPA: hypothetical protein VN971_12395, partial [Thermoanaerobaculia bacterium]|nr:hypothetical protein [Thermoanaerobaculia bacterium]